MNLLHRRGWLLLGAAALFAGGALGVACGPNGGGGDGGVDSGGDGTLPGDSGQDGNKPDGGGGDGSVTTCEAGVSGSCDVVAQNCGSGKECGLVQLSDGGFELQCMANATGSIKEGYACTQSGNSNPCVAGLECIEGRCSKHCCFGDNGACDTSHPEGFAGKCNLGLTLPNNVTAYTVCTYNKPCQPFQIQTCGAGLTCLVEDDQGTADCYAYTNGDAGQAEHTACTSNNACNDGMGCYGALDGGASNCQWNCYVPPGPFDAGITSLGAGKGGCPQGESCKAIAWQGNSLPTWFGICSK
jgi:hypothetical protein